ncbi:hydroperoxide reductase [Anaeramoeba flamelloides]|uniref:Hydroperoxide reductase n=1 Tax=Anaeramoeba flamelloides TaxID=1746091 RepID=A0AAV7ZAK1_9EUKA|nr:hydroperoxide reductase [Anaeramoeba flamelloides]
MIEHSSTEERLTISNSIFENCSPLSQKFKDENTITDLEEKIVDSLHKLHKDLEKIEVVNEFFQKKMSKMEKEDQEKLEELCENFTNLKNNYQESGKECTTNLYKLMELFKQKEDAQQEQLNRRLTSLENVKEMRDSLILENLKLKKKVSTLKKQIVTQKEESENSKQESEQEKKKIMLKRNWLNHVNVLPLKKSLEKYLENKKSEVACMEDEYDFTWNFGKKIPFSYHGENNESKRPLINSSIPFVYGGVSKVPSPVQIFCVGIISEFARSFISLCALNGVKIKEFYIENEFHYSMKAFLDLKPSDKYVTKMGIRVSVQTSEHQEDIQKWFKMAQENCSMINFLQCPTDFELEYEYSQKYDNEIRKEMSKGLFNGINSNKLKKNRRKISKSKSNKEFNIIKVRGIWDLRNSSKSSQFKGLILCEKNKKITCSIDWPVEIGGTNNGVNWHEFIAAGLSSMSLSMLVIMATLQKIKLEEIEINYIAQFDRKNLFEINNPKNSNKKKKKKQKKEFDNKLSLKYSIVSFRPGFEIQNLIQTVEKTSLCSYLAKNKIPIDFDLKINEEVSEQTLIASKQLSLLSEK